LPKLPWRLASRSGGIGGVHSDSHNSAILSISALFCDTVAVLLWACKERVDLVRDIDELERGAAANDLRSLAELGKLALVGRAGGRTPRDGVGMLAAAAEGGSAEADALIAVILGIEAQSASDWGRAIDFLGRAAARGLASAREQLTLYCPQPELVAMSKLPAPPSHIWRQMKETIDVEMLVRGVPSTLVRASPHIAVLDAFASRAECEWLIERSRPHLEKSAIFDQTDSSARSAPSRTGSAMRFDISKADFALIVIQARIAATAGFSIRCLEETNILHYNVGQRFIAHYDFLDSRHRAFHDELALRGQRAVTFLVYLNENFDGGETSFEKLGWQFKGSRGDALLFRNVDPSGTPDPFTLHAGLPPRSGEKWLLSQWIRTHPPRQPASQ
jgi:prolyl 4-hydroxylase